MICAATCFLIIPFTHSIVAVMILMMIGNAFIFLPNAVYWAVIIDTTPNNTGTYGGITHFFVNTATVIAPTLTGYLVASYGYSSMFVSAVVASLISIIAMCFVRPGEKKMHMTK
jgi:predicted MFS family arabinose efflux permease